MSEQTKTTIKGYFNTGDVPTESQYIDLVDSYYDATDGQAITSFVASNSGSWGGSSVTVTTLSPMASVTTDLSTGDVFNITLTGATLLMNPTNPTNGKGYIWYINQGSGSHTITLGSKFIIPSTATTPLAWSTAASAMDIFAVRADTNTDKYYVVSMVGGY
jgi:predicted secreted protein